MSCLIPPTTPTIKRVPDGHGRSFGSWPRQKCHVSCARCHVSHFTCHVSPVPCHQCQQPQPHILPPANSPAMHRWLVFQKPYYKKIMLNPKHHPNYQQNLLSCFFNFSNTIFDQKSPVHLVVGPTGEKTHTHKPTHKQTSRLID